jgi:hypothetical protein
MTTPSPDSTEVISANLLRAADVTVTGVDFDALDTALTTGPRRSRTDDHADRVHHGRCRSASGTRQPWPRPPVRIADPLMNELTVPAQHDLAG